MFENLSRDVELICPVCGNKKYEGLDGDINNTEDFDDSFRFKCSRCNNVFTKKELMEANKENFEANIKDMTDEIMDEISNEVKKWKL